ncbi:hypothetical protein BGZ65_000944 [Modicella reniformis]|uniref:Polysaccharide lyase 14 domain-containing protein n=1 Tax=Modicella reniformis TaxID=1440133 RepID=A0A9P6SUH2_9FUNG|nr:hypothetical protein BGZ65_000944 [Modicella reniformis]
MELTKPLRLAKKLVPGTDPFDIVSDPIVKKSKGRVLRSLYPANSYARSGDRHAQFTSTPLPKGAFAGSKSPFIRLEYQMLFQPGFKWVLGGKLPGILVGTESGCNGACSGGGSAENCFSTRMMWRAQGEGELYLYAAKSVYFPKEKPDRCSRSLDKRSPEALFNLEQKQINTYAIPSDDEYEYYNETSSMNTRGFHTSADSSKSSCLNGIKLKITPGSRNMCNPVYGISIGRGGSFKFKSGVWHNVTQIVRINSKGNAVRDGYLAVYLDGKPVVQAENLVLLKKGYNSNKSATSHDVKFMFSSFFGGATKQYATPTAQWIAWKGFKMTTSVKNVWK